MITACILYVAHNSLIVKLPLPVEMIEIVSFNPTYFDEIIGNGISHVYPLTNLSLNFLQRGHYNQDSSQYETPSIELYTEFSLEIYFLMFWILLSLQTLTIFVADRCCMNTIPESTTTWERIIHAFQKTSFPFPFANWHNETGSCQDLIRKKEETQREVLVDESYLETIKDDQAV